MCDDLPAVEVLLSQGARRSTVPLVVCLDGGQRAHCFVHGAEPEEALAVGQKATRSGVLDDRGFSAREIAEGAIADPCVRKLDVTGLHAAELPPRSLDVGAVLLRRRADIPCLAKLPPERLEARLPLRALLAQAHGQLELRGGPRGEGRVFEKCHVLLV